MKIEMGWAYGRMGGRRGAYRVRWAVLSGKRPFGRPCHKGNDNIEMCVKDVGLGCMDWIDLERTGQLPRKDSAPWSY